ncbi:hypothetical protein BU17DRAFT_48850 [Hysterangium stoloniferum]|nr:hypothetical protein BU17DRAFT_48850 [Hysterangium stoloniferum]
MSAPAPTDLWLERSRFNGILLDGVSYGILFVLTVQCVHALFQRPKHKLVKAQTRSRWLLLAYIAATFALATIGVAANAKYSQMIWIDLRNSPQGPEGLIINELGFWENRMALTSYYIMSWLMDMLLIHRCFVIWNWHILVVLLMSSLLLANIIMAILTLVSSSHGAVFTSIGFQLAFLIISVSTNFIYTILVAGRLLVLRKQITLALGEEHAKVYVSVAAMVVESSALYTVFGIIYVVTYALHSNVENLIFLWIIHVQGIAQLLIILRIAQGSAITEDVTARQSTHLQFAHSQATPDVSTHHHAHLSITNGSSSAPAGPPGLGSEVKEEKSVVYTGTSESQSQPAGEV